HVHARERRGDSVAAVRHGEEDRPRRDVLVRLAGGDRGVRPGIDLDVTARRGSASGCAGAVLGEAGNVRLRGEEAGVMGFDDPAVVRAQYADERNLRARQALWANVEGENGPVALWRVL